MNTETLKARAKLIFGEHPLNNEEIQKVEEVLKIKLPADFVGLNKSSSYEYASVFNFLNFRNIGKDNLIENTKGLWSYFECPNEFIMLHDDGTGVILMDTKNSSQVFYASMEDVENIVFRRKLNYSHQYFPTFTDFFSYLLDEEEKRRAGME